MIANRRKTEKNKLTDKILSEIKKIKLLEYNKCVLCGSKHNLELGHVFTRSYKSTIFEMDNNFIQCKTCNNYHEIDPNIYYNWVKLEIGNKRFEELQSKTRTLKKWKVYELEELMNQLKKSHRKR